MLAALRDWGYQILSDPARADMNIVTVYNLIYNASLFVEDKVGYAIGFDGLINVSGDSVLTFRPLKNRLAQTAVVIWKKYEAFTPAVNLFLNYLKPAPADDENMHTNTPPVPV